MPKNLNKLKNILKTFKKSKIISNYIDNKRQKV